MARATPAFPRPIAGFVGRQAEIERLLARVDDEILFVVCGVAGIGKSELVLELVRALRARAPWDAAIPVHLGVAPGATTARVLAQLLAATGATSEPRGEASDRAHLDAQLEALGHALDARPHVVFVDDAHHLPAEALGEVLGHLARRVCRSRLFVASRHRIAFPVGAPLPVVTMLGPLDEGSAVELARSLAERLQVPPPGAAAVMHTTHGSPFHVRQMLVPGARQEGPSDAPIGALSVGARRVLLALAVARGRPAASALRGIDLPPEVAARAVRELEDRLLLDVVGERLVVHDLVREPALAGATSGEIAQGHADAAGICLAVGEATSPLGAVDAIVHLLDAGRAGEAWRVLCAARSGLAAVGADHLLLEPLERLRVALPGDDTAITLVAVRTLVRSSSITDAERMLSRAPLRRDAAEQAHHAALLGEIAQHRGDLALAEALFARAAEQAPDAAARFAARLHLATVAALGGQSARARSLSAEALETTASPSARQRARAAWVRTVSWMFEERYERAASEARAARRALENEGLSDLASQLAMLETLAAIESEDMEHARAAGQAIDEAGLRFRVAALYRAIVGHAGGGSREASVELRQIHEQLEARGDTMDAYLAGYHGSAALAAVGELADARELAERTSALARRAGIAGLAAQSLAHQAILAAEAMQCARAHALADEALSGTHVGPRSRATAHCAHGRAYTIEGDLDRARAEIALAREAVADPELAAAQAVVDVEGAALDLVGGDLDRAIEAAERSVAHYRRRSRDYEAARARLVLAAAYLARGRRADLALAAPTIAEARAIADRGELRAMQVGLSVLAAALARRSDRAADAQALLVGALRELDPDRASVYAGVLLAAIEGGLLRAAAPGVAALLAHLGFSDVVECYLVDRASRRAASWVEAERERSARELFVDEARALVACRRGEVEVRGRPMQSAILSILVQARGEEVSAEALHGRVWGGTYHPLHHRNAIYVALNRLRSSLAEAMPGREVVVRGARGWRLADDVDACVAVPARSAKDDVRSPG